MLQFVSTSAEPFSVRDKFMATSNYLDKIIPNFSGNSSHAGDIISNLLNGTPNSGTVQNAAATFGAENGLGTGSGVTQRYGYDLYNQQGAQRQQTGLSDLSSLISSISSPTLEDQGQNLQNQQFNQNLNQNASEFNASEQSRQNQNLQDLIAQLSGGGPKQTTSFQRN